MTLNPTPKSRRIKAIRANAYYSPITNRLLEYWHQKRGAAARPRWRDIKLSELEDITPYLAIRDVIDGGEETICRYWGEGQRRVLGFDATGKLLAESHDPDSALLLIRIFRMAMRYGQPIRVVGYADFAEGDKNMTFEGIILPVDGRREGEIKHFVNAYDYDYKLRSDDLTRDCMPNCWPTLEASRSATGGS